jgi:hypothetical protein
VNVTDIQDVQLEDARYGSSSLFMIAEFNLPLVDSSIV